MQDCYQKLLFRKRVQEAVRKERGANAQYQMVDAIQMVVVGLIAGATSMVQIVKVWTDEVLMKMKAYLYVMAFVGETKEVLHSWFRCRSAYTSNGVVEFMKECMA